MKLKIIRIGNSQGIVIPKKILDKQIGEYIEYPINEPVTHTQHDNSEVMKELELIKHTIGYMKDRIDELSGNY